MFSMVSNPESPPTTSSPFGFGSSSASPFSFALNAINNTITRYVGISITAVYLLLFIAPQTPDLDDERSIYMSPTPVSRSLKADNVKEIYFKAYVDEKLDVHKKELEEELHQNRMRALEQALEEAKKESWMYKPMDF
ncbi:hypothetical protein NECAME_11637 [Necator americanus]|uniref:Uncharacterized protein n=1 Tax=Necator americanus TaxID=51031 RepID=W2T5K0_NECAM|nr:hypothetical protein NECAME_11637 [Necator americanus]ETN76471.1 hypothetical protein NECAME_11637 [Necator americanus]